ncbi:ATP-binding protein, partial [Candidatus Woesearchaeota archaeon]|nr:ATP-binding protein [Candidatus Woesearchaeota archaeon]
MSAEDYKKYIDDTLSNILLRLDRVFDKMGNYQAKPKKKPTRAQTKQPIAEQVLNQQSMEDHRYTIPLADLVMMQMVGNFDAFLELLTPNGNGEHGERFAEALRMIEDTRKQTTAQKLFPSIVEKTIEAQFGEKHVALRELGQNAIDAYTPEEQERPVLFHVEKENGHLVLRVRDYGIGMDVKGVIRDLLIPYNSGKEFDPTKIGEHGIGWYSVVDLASLVKTTTRQRDGNGAVQTLVYRDRETWKATIVPSTPDGFYGPLHKKPHGTEVTVYIPEQTTSPEDIRDFLFQYLGMVDSRNGQIFLGAAMINSAREAYRQASPIPVSIEREKKPLTMGVSKRGLSGDLNDPRFRHRNKNLEKILYTQRGLFVKYDTHPFHEETIHAQLIADLQKMGLDFWVEVPEHATLTKGRNSVIGDHRNPVLEGMYRAFEDLFLNVLLSDEQVVYHSSGTLLSSIANLFDKYYAQTAKVLEERKYSRKRRWLSKAAAAGMSAIDLGALAGRLAGKGAYYAGLGIVRGVRATPKGLRKAALYPFAHLPSDLEKLAAYLTEKAPEWGEQAAGAIRFYGPFGVAVGGGLYGGIELYKHFGWKPYLYLGYGIGGSLGLAVAGAVVYGGYRLACALPEIIQDLREVTLSDVGRAIGKSMLS